MKLNIKKIFTLVLSLLLIISMLLNTLLLSELNDKQSKLNSTLSNLSSQIAGIQNSLSSLSSKTNMNYLASISADYGTVLKEENKVEVHFSILPKEYDPKKTNVFLYCNEEKTKMTIKDGFFTATVFLNLFEHTVIDKIVIEDTTIRTEMLNYTINPIISALMHLGGRLQFGSTATAKQGIFSYTLDKMDAVAYIVGERPLNIATVEAFATIDDVEVNRYTLYYNEDETKAKYANTSTVYCAAYSAKVSDVYEIPYGQTLKLYVEVTDTDGYKIRNIIECIIISSKGKILKAESDAKEKEEAGYIILSQNGELLYDTRVQK